MTLRKKQIDQMLLIGRQMSNICYNLGQEEKPPNFNWSVYQKDLDSLARKWDEIFRSKKGEAKWKTSKSL